VPVGTAAKVKAAIHAAQKANNTQIEFDVASNPEFLKEGAAIDDFLKPDRIVIGVETEKAKRNSSPAIRPLCSQWTSNFIYGYSFRGNDKVCRQRYACNQNIFYE